MDAAITTEIIVFDLPDGDVIRKIYLHDTQNCKAGGVYLWRATWKPRTYGYEGGTPQQHKGRGSELLHYAFSAGMTDPPNV